MLLSGYVQATEPGILQLWIGMFGTAAPPAPQVFIDRQAAAPDAPPAFFPIRDFSVDGAGQPINHQCVLHFKVPDESRPRQIRIEAGGESFEFASTSLPKEVPTLMDGSFNILLSSCYSQPEDIDGLLGTIVSQIKVQPHLTVLAGDQVYLDQPLTQRVPDQNPERAHLLANKYYLNWLSGALRVPGLQAVLERAPVVCIPDDHEFWNNYPFAQKQLPDTWTDASRRLLGDTARALYEDYQMGGAPGGAGGAVRLNVDPLKMLFVDMRCDRDNQFTSLMGPKGVDAMNKWVADLIAAHAAGEPAVGLLASGQALFIDPPATDWSKKTFDAEMPNYAQFDVLQTAIGKLADNGIPVVYMTGDVHWGRVASGQDLQTGIKIYEVIASPSRLIRVPFLDTAKEAANSIKGIFGKSNPWPRHSDPDPVPDRFGLNHRFVLNAEYGQRGDQVAIVSFTRVGSGVDMQVSYYGISSDKAISQSVSTKRFELRSR
ncbi:hypothetical protein J8I87_20020 [Paraburkholderia sp. LEh10]|uniref:alkaline phosphatase D family protein n=1 Tax=Paraburkholderia sp. LEh10 TaxID=2821353 RepID=UPI001AE28F1B|nr:alkaline phosphatase D family protein [Paraburkholderia sp. LEh10]MBP0591971.1 hypothetical protein [Paraburkholderia sp. LEh10]